ncbi:hypothetical protein Dimus_026859 [Dionaea muscipula]
MAHVINTPYHELPYGEIFTAIFKAFSVPLSKVDEKRPSDTNFFKETFLNKCGLKRENGVWWLGSGVNRRRDGVDVVPEEDSDEEEEYESREELTPASSKGEPSDSKTKVEDAKENSDLVDDYFDVVDGGTASNEDNDASGRHAHSVVQKKSGKNTKTRRVDPSSIEPAYNLIHL